MQRNLPAVLILAEGAPLASVLAEPGLPDGHASGDDCGRKIMCPTTDQEPRFHMADNTSAFIWYLSVAGLAAAGLVLRLGCPRGADIPGAYPCRTEAVALTSS